MTDIEKHHLTISKDIGSDFYFTALLQGAQTAGLLDDFETENIQLQCLQFLAQRCERYNCGLSSSIREETAAGIMQSNLYTMGIYLKSKTNTEEAVGELKNTTVSDIYRKGRKLISTKLAATKHSYELVKKNRLDTPHYAYNATMDEGITAFFTAYNPDYEAHETPASIDYQLCNDVTRFSGVEFMQKYLEHLYFENQFCSYFHPKTIHHILCGFDAGYSNLLLNIFEHVLTQALGSLLAKKRLGKLALSSEDIQSLSYKLAGDDDTLAAKINQAADKILEELPVAGPALVRYIKKSMPGIARNIIFSVRSNTLHKTFVTPVNPDLYPGMTFDPGVKMADEAYREFIGELLACRYSSDKLALIREKIKSFADLEDMLLDGRLSQEEIIAVLNTLGDGETAVLFKRHPYQADIAADLSAAEDTLRTSLKEYAEQLPKERRIHIRKIMQQLAEE